MATPSNDYIKYSNLAFQMLATIAIPTYIGYKIDANNGTEYWTIILAFIGVVLSIVSVVYKVSKND